jgi:sugar phosphate isomerase/epimerase
MAIDIAGEYLHMVAAKNVRYVPTESSHPDIAAFKHDYCQLYEGLANWPKAIKALQDAKYKGPLSLHGEYSGPEDIDFILKKVRKDIEFLKKLL